MDIPNVSRRAEEKNERQLRHNMSAHRREQNSDWNLGQPSGYTGGKRAMRLTHVDFLEAFPPMGASYERAYETDDKNIPVIRMVPFVGRDGNPTVYPFYFPFDEVLHVCPAVRPGVPVDIDIRNIAPTLLGRDFGNIKLKTLGKTGRRKVLASKTARVMSFVSACGLVGFFPSLHTSSGFAGAKRRRQDDDEPQFQSLVADDILDDGEESAPPSDDDDWIVEDFDAEFLEPFCKVDGFDPSMAFYTLAQSSDDDPLMPAEESAAQYAVVATEYPDATYNIGTSLSKDTSSSGDVPAGRAGASYALITHDDSPAPPTEETQDAQHGAPPPREAEAEGPQSYENTDNAVLKTDHANSASADVPAAKSDNDQGTRVSFSTLPSKEDHLPLSTANIYAPDDDAAISSWPRAHTGPEDSRAPGDTPGGSDAGASSAGELIHPFQHSRERAGSAPRAKLDVRLTSSVDEKRRTSLTDTDAGRDTRTDRRSPPQPFGKPTPPKQNELSVDKKRPEKTSTQPFMSPEVEVNKMEKAVRKSLDPVPTVNRWPTPHQLANMSIEATDSFFKMQIERLTNTGAAENMLKVIHDIAEPDKLTGIIVDEEKYKRAIQTAMISATQPTWTFEAVNERYLQIWASAMRPGAHKALSPVMESPLVQLQASHTFKTSSHIEEPMHETGGGTREERRFENLAAPPQVQSSAPIQVKVDNAKGPLPPASTETEELSYRNLLRLTEMEEMSYLLLFRSAATWSSAPVPVQVIDGGSAVGILGRAGLPRGVLHEIWSIADKDNKGCLEYNRWALVCRLVSLVQQNPAIVVSELDPKTQPAHPFLQLPANHVEGASQASAPKIPSPLPFKPFSRESPFRGERTFDATAHPQGDVAQTRDSAPPSRTRQPGPAHVSPPAHPQQQSTSSNPFGQSHRNVSSTSCAQQSVPTAQSVLSHPPAQQPAPVDAAMLIAGMTASLLQQGEVQAKLQRETFEQASRQQAAMLEALTTRKYGNDNPNGGDDSPTKGGDSPTKNTRPDDGICHFPMCGDVVDADCIMKTQISADENNENEIIKWKFCATCYGVCRRFKDALEPAHKKPLDIASVDALEAFQKERNFHSAIREKGSMFSHKFANGREPTMSERTDCMIFVAAFIGELSIAQKLRDSPRSVAQLPWDRGEQKSEAYASREQHDIRSNAGGYTESFAKVIEKGFINDHGGGSDWLDMLAAAAKIVRHMGLRRTKKTEDFIKRVMVMSCLGPIVRRKRERNVISEVLEGVEDNLSGGGRRVYDNINRKLGFVNAGDADENAARMQEGYIGRQTYLFASKFYKQLERIVERGEAGGHNARRVFCNTLDTIVAARCVLPKEIPPHHEFMTRWALIFLRTFGTICPEVNAILTARSSLWHTNKEPGQVEIQIFESSSIAAVTTRSSDLTDHVPRLQFSGVPPLTYWYNLSVYATCATKESLTTTVEQCVRKALGNNAGSSNAVPPADQPRQFFQPTMKTVYQSDQLVDNANTNDAPPPTAMRKRYISHRLRHGLAPELFDTNMEFNEVGGSDEECPEVDEEENFDDVGFNYAGTSDTGAYAGEVAPPGGGGKGGFPELMVIGGPPKTGKGNGVSKGFAKAGPAQNGKNPGFPSLNTGNNPGGFPPAQQPQQQPQRGTIGSIDSFGGKAFKGASMNPFANKNANPFGKAGLLAQNGKGAFAGMSNQQTVHWTRLPPWPGHPTPRGNINEKLNRADPNFYTRGHVRLENGMQFDSLMRNADNVLEVQKTEPHPPCGCFALTGRCFKGCGEAHYFVRELQNKLPKPHRTMIVDLKRAALAEHGADTEPCTFPGTKNVKETELPYILGAPLRMSLPTQIPDNTIAHEVVQCLKPPRRIGAVLGHVAFDSSKPRANLPRPDMSQPVAFNADTPGATWVPDYAHAHNPQTAGAHQAAGGRASNEAAGQDIQFMATALDHQQGFQPQQPPFQQYPQQPNQYAPQQPQQQANVTGLQTSNPQQPQQPVPPDNGVFSAAALMQQFQSGAQAMNGFMRPPGNYNYGYRQGGSRPPGGGKPSRGYGNYSGGYAGGYNGGYTGNSKGFRPPYPTNYMPQQPQQPQMAMQPQQPQQPQMAMQPQPQQQPAPPGLQPFQQQPTPFPIQPLPQQPPAAAAQQQPPTQPSGPPVQPFPQQQMVQGQPVQSQQPLPAATTGPAPGNGGVPPTGA